MWHSERMEVTRRARDEGGLVEAEGRRQLSGVFYREHQLRTAGGGQGGICLPGSALVKIQTIILQWPHFRPTLCLP